MDREITISIVAVGVQGSGKTRIIHAMAKAINKEFEITAQIPPQYLHETETYTFKAKLK